MEDDGATSQASSRPSPPPLPHRGNLSPFQPDGSRATATGELGSFDDTIRWSMKGAVDVELAVGIVAIVDARESYPWRSWPLSVR